MSYCFNPACENPQNPENVEHCLACNESLVLRNRYRAIALIEDGNFGRTLLATDQDRLNAKCVIKQFFKWRKVQDRAEAMSKATHRFEKEAALLLQLGTHAQIPTLLGCFEQDRRLYIVQEYIDGHNLLEELLEQGRWDEQQVRDLLNDLLPVLEYIHEHGVIHRDIKPMNIIRRLCDRKLVLIDFGLAKHLDTLGKTGSMYGTEGYAPIEQTRGKVYPASDLYSLGATCIQMLTGAAFEDLYEAEKGIWIWREYLRKKGTDISDQLSHILEKLLKDALTERYQSAIEVLKDLGNGIPRWRCDRTLSGHFGSVDQVSFSPDGETLASSSADQTLKVWQLSSGNLIQSVESESRGVNFAVISPDGQILASGGGDDTIGIWHLATEQLLYVLTGHAGVVCQVAFSPDGQILASGSEDSTIKLWHLGRGKLLNTLTGHRGAVRAIAVNPDGNILASGSEDKTIKIWHKSSGQLLHNLTEHSNTINSLAMSPDGEILASGSGDNTMRIWHLGSGKLVDILCGHGASVRSLAFSPNGQIIASGSDDRTIKLWRCA